MINWFDEDNGETIYVSKKGRKKKLQNTKLLEMIFEKIETNFDEDAYSNYIIKTFWDIIDSDACEWINADIMDREAHENGLHCSFFIKKTLSAKKNLISYTSFPNLASLSFQTYIFVDVCQQDQRNKEDLQAVVHKKQFNRRNIRYKFLLIKTTILI